MGRMSRIWSYMVPVSTAQFPLGKPDRTTASWTGWDHSITENPFKRPRTTSAHCPGGGGGLSDVWYVDSSTSGPTWATIERKETTT